MVNSSGAAASALGAIVAVMAPTTQMAAAILPFRFTAELLRPPPSATPAPTHHYGPGGDAPSIAEGKRRLDRPCSDLAQQATSVAQRAGTL